MLPLTIRAAKSGDSKALARIYYQAIHQTCQPDYSEDQREAWAPGKILDNPQWKRLVTPDPRYQIIVAEASSETAGFAELRDDGYIDCFFVHPDWNGQGVGKELFKYLLKHAANHLHEAVEQLSVHASITAKPFFQASGFSVVRRQVVIIRGVQLTNYVMTRPLSGKQKPLA